MTDSMVERVARAVFERHEAPTAYPTSWEDAAPSEKARAMDCARAALEAMFEPTDAMAEFAEENFDRNSDNIKTCWRAMISAALAQPTGEKT